MKKIILASVAVLAIASTLSADVVAAKCTGCHGADWSKAALGKSKVVSEMTHAEIAASLIGYKNGTYGGPMKGVMKGQVTPYSDAELEAFSQTIGK